MWANIYFRTQAAPTVIGISGAVHKKYKTHGEAWEAFNKAGREGKVRAIQVDPQPGDFGEPAPISAATFLSVVPDNHRQWDFHQDEQYLQSASPACAAGSPTRHPAIPPMRRTSQRDRTANSTTNDVTWPIRREPGAASRNTSSPVSAHNFDLGNSIGAGPLRRATSEYHGNSGQPLRTMSGSGSPSPFSSPSSRPVGRSRVYEHADRTKNTGKPQSMWPFDTQNPGRVTGRRHLRDCCSHVQTTSGPFSSVGYTSNDRLSSTKHPG